MMAFIFLSKAARRVFLYFFGFLDYSVVMSGLVSTGVPGAKESDAG